MTKDYDLGRLKWCCRRGMLELDLLLMPFLDKQFTYLPAEQQQAFVELLDEEDPTLQGWLLGQETPKESRFCAIVEAIKDVAKNIS